jgi:glutamate/aspartate transport system substrate-binding protein
MKYSIVLGVTAFAFVANLLPTAAQASTLDKIKAADAIVIGNRESSIPFSYLDDNRSPRGYSMDICMHIVEAVKTRLGRPNLRVDYRLVTSNNRIPLMKEGAIDIECGSTTNNLERQKDVAFSVTTFVAQTRFLSRKSSAARILFHLKGKQVVATDGTTSLKQLVEFNERHKYNMTIVKGKDHAESFAMVDDGRALAFVMDDILLASLAASSRNPGDYTLSMQGLSVEPYGIMLRRDDPAFKKLVDDAIIRLFESGEIYKIYNKWFTSPIPPKGINLNVPMSDILRKVIKKPTDSGNPAYYN